MNDAISVTYLGQKDSFSSIAAGLDQLLQAVGSSMGPRGQATLILKQGDDDVEHLTHASDGLAIAEEFVGATPAARAAISAVTQAAKQTSAHAGDGTSTTIIIACILFIEAAKLANAGHSMTDLRHGIAEATTGVRAGLREHAVACDTEEALLQVALASSRGRVEDARAVVSAAMTAGVIGSVEIDVSIPEELPSSWALELVTECSVKLPGRAVFSSWSGRTAADVQVVIVGAGATEGGAAKLLLQLHDALTDDAPAVVLVPRDSRIDMLLHESESLIRSPITVVDSGKEGAACWEDAAAFADVTPIGSTGISVGRVDEARLNGRQVTLVGGRADSDAYQARVADLEALAAHRTAQQQQTLSPDPADWGSWKEKAEILARFSGRHVQLRGHESSPEAVKDRNTILRNMLSSVRSAHRAGAVQGGGATLRRVATELVTSDPTDPRQLGAEVFKRALLAPATWLTRNAGEADTTADPPAQSPVMDSLLTAEAAISNASSVACSLLNTSGLLHVVGGVHLRGFLETERVDRPFLGEPEGHSGRDGPMGVPSERLGRM